MGNHVRHALYDYRISVDCPCPTGHDRARDFGRKRRMTPFKAEYERRLAGGAIRADADYREALDALNRVSAALGDLPEFGGHGRYAVPRGVYLWGGVGRGKSLLMDILYESAAGTAKWRVHFHGFMQEVHADLQRSRSASGAADQGDPIAQLADAFAAEARLLCLDELEVTDIADAMIVGRLFDKLFARGVVLVVTSNAPPDELYRDGPNREIFLPFIERLKTKTTVVELSGEHDYRTDGATAETTYLHPLTPDTAATFDALWRKAVADHGEASATLTVHGREVAFRRAAGENLRVTFDEVCGQTLGPDDHLAIAAQFGRVFLENVPQIGAEHHDEGRRLVTLIDALYEARTRLVVLAAAEPDDLFADGASEAYQRTTSRLEEMRSVAWPHGAAEGRDP